MNLRRVLQWRGMDCLSKTEVRAEEKRRGSIRARGSRPRDKKRGTCLHKHGSRVTLPTPLSPSRYRGSTPYRVIGGTKQALFFAAQSYSWLLFFLFFLWWWCAAGPLPELAITAADGQSSITSADLITRPQPPRPSRARSLGNLGKLSVPDHLSRVWCCE